MFRENHMSGIINDSKKGCINVTRVSTYLDNICMCVCIYICILKKYIHFMLLTRIN